MHSHVEYRWGTHNEESPKIFLCHIIGVHNVARVVFLDKALTPDTSCDGGESASAGMSISVNVFVGWEVTSNMLKNLSLEVSIEYEYAAGEKPRNSKNHIGLQQKLVIRHGR